MEQVYVATAVATITANLWVAVADLRRAPFVMTNSAAVGVPPSWLPWLGLAKGAGAVGLAISLVGVAWLGALAAAGLTVFFTGALAAHVRAKNWSLTYPLAFLALALACLLLSVARGV